MSETLDPVAGETVETPDEIPDTERSDAPGAAEDEAEARADEDFEPDDIGDADSGARGFGGYGEMADDDPRLNQDDDCGFEPCDW